MGPIHVVADGPEATLASIAQISYISTSGYNSGAKSWVVIRDRRC